MTGRRLSPLDVFLQLESDMRHTAQEAMRAIRFQPCVDMYETNEALVLKVELAGVRTEHLNITLSGDDRHLLISGERTEPDEERHDRTRCFQLEVYYGPFQREIPLPSEVRIDRDQIRAIYRDGFLQVTLRKREPTGGRARVIEVDGDS
ncbi:MAG: Hsp20/alpha crystallin family protein [Armatimonadetes bacterium]|nr:Hsp20/alpha crystallin family protein [Armatimonadota bacterium]MDE2206496.1 Hsp20/alpha crystallin family protein [Armatimonadota bacterium]